MATTGDDAIDAAFASSPPSAASQSSTGDEAIDTAFQNNGKSFDDQVSARRAELNSNLFPALWTGAKELAGGVAHGVGTLVDVATGTAPGKGSHAESFAAPFALDPVTAEVERDPEQERLRGKISEGYDKAFGTGPLAQTIKERAPQAVEALGTLVPVLRGAEGLATEGAAMTAQDVVSNAAKDSPQSMGAAAATRPVSAASAPLQQAIVNTARKTGGAVNLDALNNHFEADEHGVQLTKGQATRDPAQFSAEQNTTHPAVVKRINGQETQMTDAIDNIRREAGPSTVQNNPIQNGQIAVDALKSYDAPIKADIKARYQKLIDANGGTVPIDTPSFLNSIDSALKKQYLTSSVPPAGADILNSLRRGEPLDFEGFEAARTRLAEAQREGGSQAQAAGIIRNQLEQLPLSPAAARLKGLADSARSAAKARFDALEADPAYAAAVDDTAKIGTPSPLADKFLDKYALNAPKANLDLLRQKLGPEGQEAVTSHTLSAIRDRAVTPNGKVSPNGYNGALEKYGPKLDSLVPQATRDSLDSLGRVITNAKVPPPGSYVNYSKSGVIMNAAKEMGEGALNAKTLGLGVPVLKGIAKQRWARETLAPGAGLDAVEK